MLTLRACAVRRKHQMAASVASSFALVSAFVLVPQAAAQPTGNPKGTTAPPETTALKSSSSPNSGTGSTDSGKLVGTDSQTRARLQGAKPPGGGTEGGLQRRDANDATNGGATRSDKGSATALPLPPSKSETSRWLNNQAS